MSPEVSPTKRLKHTVQTPTVQRRRRPTRSSSVLHSHSIVLPVNVEQAETPLEMSVEEVSQIVAPSAEVVGEQAAKQIRITAADLSPLPHVEPAARGQSKRKTQGTLVLSSSPNVFELKENLTSLFRSKYHRLQPLDVSLMKPLSTVYSQ